jgi:RNA polymerase sigma-32 factor
MKASMGFLPLSLLGMRDGQRGAHFLQIHCHHKLLKWRNAAQPALDRLELDAPAGGAQAGLPREHAVTSIKDPKPPAAKAPKRVKKSAPAEDRAEAAAGSSEGDDDEPSDDIAVPETDAFEPEVLDASADLADDEEDEEDEESADEEGAELGDDGDDAPGTAIARSGDSVSRFDPLSAYMREVQRHRLLSPDEEHSLAVGYKEHPEDMATAARLVTANLRLVVKIAYEYRRAYKNMMDLIQEGNIGLMQAVKKYDPYRGVKLSSYAAWWIRAYMLRFILNNWRLVKLGTTQAQRKLFFNLSKEKARLTALGIEPSNAEIAKRLNVAESEVSEMDKRLARSDASLDASVGEGDGRTVSRLELMPSPGSTPDQIAEGAELSELLQARLGEFRGTLAGKDVVIFDKRVIADEPLTLQELGDEFGVSRERVRQLEARLTGKLRDYLKQTLGDAVELS